MKLEFFYYTGCPFCHRVMDVIDQLGINLTYCDIMNDTSALERHIKTTGRRTVPCLYIDDKPMFESQDIINWLVQNKDKLK
ncbi:glutaredoxin family protein [Halobacteriovorax sp. GFR7]|uniref:glutaredoxin family protein n=1 Tax=unclassified Halobacteriovorax TaxID=2639665 RepID=UPI0037134011